MSGIAGYLSLKGAPVAVDLLQPAIAELQPLGPDRLSTWSDGAAAMAHLALDVTPEAPFECWPLRGESGLILLADARLDNRAELCRRLPYVMARRHHPITDAELILAAHERWGAEAPAYLVGDYAYALWHPAERVLRLVRSPFGLKSLFYRMEQEYVAFATTLPALRAMVPERLSVNLPWVASVVAWDMERLRDESVFQEIRPVPAGQWLRLDLERGRIIQEPFWTLTPREEYAAWTEKEWVEAFRERLDEGVGTRLRSRGPVAIALSGGLDSSSIALVTHRLMYDERRVPPAPVHTFTDRMEGWPDTEEAAYRDAVVSRLPYFRNEWVDVRHAWTWDTVDAWHRYMSTPANLANLFGYRHRIERAREEGCRVMLLGHGGDIVTGGEDYALAAVFRSLPWRSKLRELPHFTRGSVQGARRFARKLLDPYLPSWWSAWRRRRAGFESLYSEEVERLARRERDRGRKAWGDSPLQRHLRTVLFSAPFLYPFEQAAGAFALNGMECRCPFYDQRLVELIFHLPAHLRVSGGQTRITLKRALKDDLPPLLIARTSKADFTRFTAFSVRPEDHSRAVALPPQALTRRQGWLNEALWDKWAEDREAPMHPVHVYRIAHLEHWLAQIGAS